MFNKLERSEPRGRKIGEVLLFDPLDKNYIMREISDDYSIFLLQHGLDIPVGIGFSLSALPLVINNWKQLAHTALRTLWPYNQLLETFGIKLRNPTSNLTNNAKPSLFDKHGGKIKNVT